MPPFMMSLLGAAGSSANGGQQLIRSAVSRVIGLMAGAFMGGIRLMFNSIVGVFRTGANMLTGLVTSVFKSAFGLMKVGLVGLAAGIGATVVSIQKAVETVKRLGNELNDLRASGFGIGSAASIQRNFRAYGLNPNFGGLTPDALSARAGAWGLPGVSDRNFIPALAAQYKNSDPYMRDYLLDNFNINNDETRRVMMMSQADLNGQGAFQNRVQAGLGINPSTVAGLSQQTELLSQRMTILKDAVFMKMAEVALPRLLAVGERVVNIIGANSDNIGSIIDSAFEKVNSAIINVATILLKIPEAMFALADSVLSFAEIALKAVPMVWDLFLRGVAFVQDALGNLVGLATNGFSHLTGLAEMMAQAFVGMGETVMQVWQVIEGPMQSIFDGIIDFLERLGRAAPALTSILETVGKVPGTIEKGAKGLGISDEWSAALGLAGLPLLWAGAKRAPGWLWNAGKGALGLGGGAASTASTAAKAGNVFTNMLGGAGRSAATNPGMWARIAASPVGRYGLTAARAVMAPIGGGALFDIGAGAASGALATGTAAGAARGGLLASGSSLLRHPVTQGVLLGLVGYNDLQQRGWLPGNPASLTQIGQYAWDNTLGGWFGGGNSASQGKPKPKPSFPGFHMPSMSSMAGMGMGAIGALNTNPASSSWATGLDERFGGQISGFSNNALNQVGDIRKYLDGVRDKYDSDALVAEMRKIGGKLDEQTKYAKETAEGVKGADDRAAGYALYRYAKESGMAMRRQT